MPLEDITAVPSNHMAGDAAFETLAQIVAELAPTFEATVATADSPPPAVTSTPVAPPGEHAEPKPPGQPLVWVSFGLQAVSPTIPVQLLASRVPELINAVGIAAVAAGLRDGQFWLEKRFTKDASGLREIWGHIVDVDRPCTDPLADVQAAGLPVPNLHFRTVNGFKPASFYNRPATLLEFEFRAMQHTLAFEGGDCGFPRSSTARPSRSFTALRQPFPGLATAVADPEEIAETGKPRAR